MKKILIILFLTGLLLPVHRVTAQFKLDKAILINKDNGLPSNDIRVITKSDDGFVWIGTRDGLCRFDGLQFHTYKPEEGNPHSILSKDVNAVVSDKDKVWVGTSMGVSKLDIYTGKFRNYQFTAKGKSDSVMPRGGMDVSSLCKDSEGNIWVGTREYGVCRYDAEKDDFVFYNYVTSDTGKVVPVGYQTILSLEYSRRNDSIIWAGTVAGLQEINKYTGKVNHYYYENTGKRRPGYVNAFRRLYYHDDGLLYAGTWRAGVNVYNPQDHTLRALAGDNDPDVLFENAVSSVVRKSEHEIWITTGLGLLVYNSAAKLITYRKRNQLLDGIFYGVEYVDESNRIWSAHMNGISIYDPLLQQFRNEPFVHLLTKGKWSFSFNMIFDSATNTIVDCPRFGEGIYLYHCETREWTSFTYSNSGPAFPQTLSVRGFARQNKDLYTISADEGLFTFSMKTKRLELFPLQPELKFLRRGPVLWDKKGRFWFCADHDGLIRWDPKTNQVYRYQKELGLTRPGAQVFALTGLYEDSRSNIWIKRTGGYSVYIYAKDTIVNFMAGDPAAKNNAVIHSFAEDNLGHVWISAGNGAAGFALADNPAAGLVHQMTWQSGMYVQDNYINLATDRNGNIWGCSDKRLIKVNSRDYSTTTFDFRYGVDDPEFFGFIILPDDELVMGARNGIIVGNPHELRRNLEPPRPYLTGVEVLQQPYSGAVPLFGEKPLQFKYWQNFFSFSFSAQAYSLAKETRFRYRLQGFDDWVETTDRHYANYTNVPGGKYVFQLQAANNEGVWNKEILSVPVVIATAWWTTAWFYVVVAIALVSFSWWAYKRNISQVKQREYVRSEFEKKLANVEMSALRAQMNPHFLFNSLNSIDSYIIRNESKKASEYLNNFARLIRLILQNSRSNYISLKDELETLELYLQMEALRFKGKFAYELEVPADLDTAAIDIPPMLIQPYVENAIWHGLMQQQNQSGGKVKVSIVEKEGMLLCIVEDNGIGRKKAMELKAKKSGISRRSMGMVITQDRMEIINKLYDTQTAVQVTDLEDEKGNAAGTRVVLTIPV